MSIIKNYQSTKGNCKVTFTYPNLETVKKVQILGDFNQWDSTKSTSMKAGKTEWSAVIELPAGNKYEFRYLLNGKEWDNDHASDSYIPSPFEGINNSVIIIDPILVSEKPTQTKKEVKTKTVVSTPKTVAAKTKPAPVKEAPKASEKKVAAKQVNVEKDDLTKIEGIGPKIDGILTTAGIGSFDLLSKAKLDTLKSLLDAAGSRYKMHDPSTWAKQAKLAATGKWAELKKLQDELNGGRAPK